MSTNDFINNINIENSIRNMQNFDISFDIKPIGNKENLLNTIPLEMSIKKIQKLKKEISDKFMITDDPVKKHELLLLFSKCNNELIQLLGLHTYYNF